LEKFTIREDEYECGARKNQQKTILQFNLRVLKILANSQNKQKGQENF
jgi:hypothetical protein